MVIHFSCPGKCLSLLSLLFSCPVLLLLLLLFLLLLLLCIFTCKGFIITVVMITNLVLSIAMVMNTNLDILNGKNSLSLSLPSDGFIGLAMPQRF